MWRIESYWENWLNRECTEVCTMFEFLQEELYKFTSGKYISCMVRTRVFENSAFLLSITHEVIIPENLVYCTRHFFLGLQVFIRWAMWSYVASSDQNGYQQYRRNIWLIVNFYQSPKLSWNTEFLRLLTDDVFLCYTWIKRRDINNLQRTWAHFSYVWFPPNR